MSKGRLDILEEILFEVDDLRGIRCLVRSNRIHGGVWNGEKHQKQWVCEIGKDSLHDEHLEESVKKVFLISSSMCIEMFPEGIGDNFNKIDVLLEHGEKRFVGFINIQVIREIYAKESGWLSYRCNSLQVDRRIGI